AAPRGGRRACADGSSRGTRWVARRSRGALDRAGADADRADDGRSARSGREVPRRRLHGRSRERAPDPRQGHRRAPQGGAQRAVRSSARRVLPRWRPRRGRRGRHGGGDQGLLMPSYAPGLLDEIRAGVDIVELVGRFVNLRKAGQNYKGLCPFHGEKTPSFMVNPKKGIFHCFGCGVGGDVFGFLMRQDRLSFPEAVRVLARQAGVALPDERGPRSGDSGREDLSRAVELAAGLYTERLWTAGGE